MCCSTTSRTIPCLKRASLPTAARGPRKKYLQAKKWSPNSTSCKTRFIHRLRDQFLFSTSSSPRQITSGRSILVKDLVREALRKTERQGNHAALHEDLKKILGIAELLHGNHSRGKAIFACSE